MRGGQLISGVKYIQNSSLHFFLYPICNVSVVLKTLLEFLVVAARSIKIIHPIVADIDSSILEVEDFEIVYSRTAVGRQPHKFPGVVHPPEDIPANRMVESSD